MSGLHCTCVGTGVFIFYSLWGAGKGHVDTVWGRARGHAGTVGGGRFLGGFGHSKNILAVICSKNRYLGGSPIIIIIGLTPVPYSITFHSAPN